MSTAAEMVKLGWQYHRAGYFDQAEMLYQQALQADPQNVKAKHYLAGIAHHKGQFHRAAELIRQVIAADPNEASYHINLGLALVALGQLDEADASFRRALQLDRGRADAYFNLGLVFHHRNELANAVVCYQQALSLKPDYSDAHHNLADAIAKLNQFDQAVRHLQEALKLNPHFAEAYNNLGSALLELGQLDLAVAAFQITLQYRPDLAEAQGNLRNALSRLELRDKAGDCSQHTVHREPNLIDVQLLLADRLSEIGMAAEAQANFESALRLQPRPMLRVLSTLVLPPMYESKSSLQAWRQQLTNNLARLHAEGVTVDITTERAEPRFFLIYQGLDDRELQCQLSRLYVPPREAEQPFKPSPPAKIRIGFISRFFTEHNIARLMGGLITDLSRDRFDVTAISVGAHSDARAKRIQQQADHFVQVPFKLPAARSLIAQQHLDVLFYTDIGMEPMTYSLAFSRLAPVQCATWGHGVTTGIPTIDYFISSIHLESVGSEQQYTEQLVRLKALAVPYYRIAPPKSFEGRDHFSLPESATIYACPQSLFKIHPDFDAILAGILRQDPCGLVVMLQGKFPRWTELLRQRFATTLPDVHDRIQFLPRLTYEDFLNLNAVADVLLDPFPCGGGNTSYEGLALGMPIVTLPPPLMRGRITFALYSQMGVMDCVAGSPAEYVKLAVKLGTDADYRADVRARIIGARDMALENSTGIRDLEVFLQEAVERVRGGRVARTERA